VLEVVRPLADYSAAAGVPTVVLYGRRPETPLDLARVFDERVRVVEVPGWGERGLGGSALGMLRAARVVRGELARHDGGVVHLHSSYAGFAGRLAVGRGWRIFYSPHGYSFQYESISPLARRLARVSESMLGRRGRTIAVSNAEGALAAGIVGRRRVIVVQSGVDLPELREVPRSSRFSVVLVGRAAVHRRPAQVGELVERLADLDAEFTWIGDGPERAALEAAGVDVRGWQDRDELTGALLAADAVLHLSAYEGFPVAVLEAMAAAKPVVASELPPIREALADTGILVRGVDEAETALRRLHEDPGFGAELGRRARARVEQAFTKKRMAEQTLAAYALD
jgi:glycosyltransferase involved in cell wall biosynthesis